MKQFCGTSDCALDPSPSSTAPSLTTSSVVEQTSLTTSPTSDPLNIMGKVGAVVISLMIVVGVVGNVLVLTAIVHCPQLRRSYNAFIASLSVTDLIFNVTVMPLYVDTYIHRAWRFSEPAVCRWHTFFGTIVIVSSSFHIALIATSRYHVIVHPRFYSRWLSSGAAIIAQIAFAWIAAIAVVLPGIVDVLPTDIRYSDQLSRCNYDREASYSALSVVFSVGFIVPCVVMGYCYGMIWRRTLQVRLRVDGHSTFPLLKIRQQNDDFVLATNRSPPFTVIPSNACVAAQEAARTEPLLCAGNSRQPATQDDKIADTRRPTSVDKNTRTDCVMECRQGTAADCRDRLLCIVDNKTINVAVDRPRVEVSDVASTAIRSSTATSEGANIARCNDDIDDASDVQKKAGESQRRINSSDHYQLETSPFSASSSDKPDSLSPSMSIRNSRHVTARETGLFDDHAANANDDRPAAEIVKEHETFSLQHISVVITPATTSSSAVTALRESPTAVAASDVTDKNGGIEEQLQRLTKSDSAHLSAGYKRLPITQNGFRMSPFRRRVASRDVHETSPASSSPTGHRHRSHALHMILAVFFAFVLTYLPYTVTNLADRQARLDRNVYMITSLAFWAGSCINPLIYGIMNVQFRRAYVSIVVNCWRHSVARCHRL